MQKGIYLIVIILFSFCSCSNIRNKTIKERTVPEAILKIEMTLSAFGVESDSFPSIDAVIDFVNDSSHCEKSFYNPAIKGSVYSLNKSEIKSILKLLNISELEKLKSKYTDQKTDQPTSTLAIYTTKRKFKIEDYGLNGDYPLQELYKRVYRF